MRLQIEHTTTYRYTHPVGYGLQQLRLVPKTRDGHTVVDWNIEISGGIKQAEFDDHHNNHVTLVATSDEARELVIRSYGTIETIDAHGIVGAHRGPSPLWLYLKSTAYTKPGPRLRALLRGFSLDKDNQISSMHELSARIIESVAYQVGTTDAQTTSEDAIEHGMGVCQDHAHVFVAAARLLGFPARYVSGYMMMNETIIQDAAHAWAEVHLDDLGWVAFDISSQISPDDKYVRIATGLDYIDAAPISGIRYGHNNEEMLVTLQVQQ